MRRAWPAPVIAFVIAVVGTSGCKSTQPDRLQTRTASLTVGALAKKVDLFDCYEVWVDATPGDPVPDLDTGFRQCFQRLGKVTRSVPWRYSLAISVIHEGSTTEEQVTSLAGHPGSSVQPGDGIDDFVSLTDYDLSAPVGQVRSPDQSGNYFLDPREVSTGNPIYLASRQFDPGVPNVLQETPAFTFEVNSGDTIIVRGRKQALVDAPAFLPTDEDPEMAIEATLRVNGVTVTPNPPGGSTSSFDDKAGISFSFTVR
jgi:hypothetical protein